jgi:hypothetical protein
MEDGHDLDEIGPKAINDAVVALDDLAKLGVANLRHNSPRSRIGLESRDRRNESFNEQICELWRIVCHVSPYRLDVFDGLRSPDDPYQ